MNRRRTLHRRAVVLHPLTVAAALALGVAPAAAQVSWVAPNDS